MRLAPDEAPNYRGPVSYDGVDRTGDVDRYWRDGDAKRRKAATWNASGVDA
jgi:hypothetical protein